MNKTIALLTDFGSEDTYTGVMKGVILNIAPNVNLVDLNHSITPQHVRQAAFALLNSYQYFPERTIFLVVVDPGVGSTRRPIAVAGGGYTFIAPDNGVLSYALAEIDTFTSVELSNPQFHLSNVSQTFHGRDIFAPCAAHVANGVAAAELGNQLDGIIQLPRPEMSIRDGRILGEVVDIDRFGNIVTSIGHLRWESEDRLMLSPVFGENLQELQILAQEAVISVHGQVTYGMRLSYSEALRGDFLGLVGSSGYLEIAVNQGNAAQRLDVVIGDRVELEVGELDAAIRD